MNFISVRDCGSLSNPSYGSVSHSQTTEGYTAYYTCNSPHVLSGSSSRTCGSDGYWTNSAPSCLRDCGGLSNPTDGSVSYSQTLEGYTATYSCNSGYQVSGSSSRTCQSNAVWSNSAPTCLRDCGSLSNPADGSVSYSQTTEGSIATYSCSSGFEMTGASSTVCGSDGVWSNSAPTCTSLY